MLIYQSNVKSDNREQLSLFTVDRYDNWCIVISLDIIERIIALLCLKGNLIVSLAQLNCPSKHWICTNIRRKGTILYFPYCHIKRVSIRDSITCFWIHPDHLMSSSWYHHCINNLFAINFATNQEYRNMEQCLKDLLQKKATETHCSGSVQTATTFYEAETEDNIYTCLCVNSKYHVIVQ